jgi:hypothetical protein
MPVPPLDLYQLHRDGKSSRGLGCERLGPGTIEDLLTPRRAIEPNRPVRLDRLTVDPDAELFVRSDGTMQSGPDPGSENAKLAQMATKRAS